MKERMILNMSKTTVTTFISIIWTVIVGVIFLGLVTPDPSIIEKAYSIEMMIVGYYLGKNDNKTTTTATTSGSGSGKIISE